MKAKPFWEDRQEFCPPVFFDNSYDWCYNCKVKVSES